MVTTESLVMMPEPFPCQTPHQAKMGGGTSWGEGPTFWAFPSPPMSDVQASDQGSQPPGKVVLGLPKNLDSGWGKDQMTPLGIEPASFAEVH